MKTNFFLRLFLCLFLLKASFAIGASGEAQNIDVIKLPFELKSHRYRLSSLQGVPLWFTVYARLAALIELGDSNAARSVLCSILGGDTVPQSMSEIVKKIPNTKHVQAFEAASAKGVFRELKIERILLKMIESGQHAWVQQLVDAGVHHGYSVQSRLQRALSEAGSKTPEKALQGTMDSLNVPKDKGSILETPVCPHDGSLHEYSVESRGNVVGSSIAMPGVKHDNRTNSMSTMAARAKMSRALSDWIKEEEDVALAQKNRQAGVSEKTGMAESNLTVLGDKRLAQEYLKAMRGQQQLADQASKDSVGNIGDWGLWAP